MSTHEQNVEANTSAEHGPAFRQLASVLARSPVPPVPAGFARRMQRRVDDLGEQSKFDQSVLSVLGVGMAMGAVWQFDLEWLGQFSLPSVPVPMLLAASAACAVAWLVDRVFADR